MEMEPILVINSGSSSYKCCLFEGSRSEQLWKAHLEWKENFRDAHLKVESAGIDENISIHSVQEGLECLLKTLPECELGAIGHRVVHGGEVFREITPITEDVKAKIRELAYLAPLHNPINLEGIETAETLFPGIPQYAVFDTAFHQTLSEAAAVYPIPYKWRQKGIRRYGFHGISHAYCSKRAAFLLQKEGQKVNKMIICHLGAGASLSAVDNGISVDTTMGMTPLEGLMMASRSGTVDPGLIFHLLNQEKLSPKEVDRMLNKESGLLGISGISEDMRDLMDAARKGNRLCGLAIELFIHSLRRHIGMMLGALQGLDALVFTAGIGEHDPDVREKACSAFSFLGLKIDPEKNRSPSQNEREISTTDSKVRVFVIPTQEEWEIQNQIRSQLSYRS